MDSRPQGRAEALGGAPKAGVLEGSGAAPDIFCVTVMTLSWSCDFLTSEKKIKITSELSDQITASQLCLTKKPMYASVWLREESL